MRMASTLPTVHPHGRGEYVRSRVEIVTASGSPPRAWGIHKEAGSSTRLSRFTPTGVGNTIEIPLGIIAVSVHPHGRGEYDARPVLDGPDDGSPPRAWGIQMGRCRRRQMRRFTPTGVGNTGRMAIRLRTRAVHPHGRGEYLAASAARSFGPGSPPRAWGIRANP